eukprot:CAMPEP_0174233870 /NCGR_PEP_ID=MMETSP0417-20130205/3789_1 /TAXON_ID=242541 /ORGANISM="Mayorella sp, Strain BSH-02190019" /LENGTH=1779 /DNA_ID=CAMNT_0015312155 /DNA_START=274 /DNA_END=5609 /DNA_ORIENTATION=+
MADPGADLDPRHDQDERHSSDPDDDPPAAAAPASGNLDVPAAAGARKMSSASPSGQPPTRAWAKMRSSFSQAKRVQTEVVEEVHESHPREALIGDVLKSLHVEKTLTDKKIADEVKSHPELKAMFVVAEDDVAVEEQPRQLRTVTTSVTDDVDVSNAEPFVQEAIRLFNQPWTRVHKKSLEYGSYANLLTDSSPPSLPAEDSVDFDGATAPPGLDEHVLRNFNEQEEAKRRTALAQKLMSHQPLFTVYDGPRNPVLCARGNPQAYDDQNCMRVLFEAEKLEFAVGNFEPMFVSVAIYDVIRRVKVTESFNFDLNSDGVISLLPERKAGRTPKSTARAAIFPVERPSPDLFLAVKVEKIQSGQENAAAVEPYMKGSGLRPKDKEKLVAQVNVNAQRLGKFLQPFAHGYLPLFDDNGRLHCGKATRIQLTRSKNDLGDDSFCDLVSKDFYLKNKGNEARSRRSVNATPLLERKLLPCDFVVNCRQLKPNEEIPGCVTSTLLPVIPFPPETKQVTREMQAFTDKQEASAPLSEYMHTFYFYPISVNLNRHPNSSSRNVALKIRLLPDDEDPHAPGLPVCYGRSSQPDFCTEIITSSTYHQTRPWFFNEEVKIRLPANVCNSHHLVVHFYHLACQQKRKKDVQVENELGFAVIPLFEDGRIVPDDQHARPVSITYCQHYMKPSAVDKLKYVDGGKQVFTYRTRLESSIYSQEYNLNAFLHVASLPTTQEIQLTRSLNGLGDVDGFTQLRFFPLLANMLLHTLRSHTEDEVAKNTLFSLARVLGTVSSLFPTKMNTEQTPVLQTYLAYLLDDHAAAHRTDDDALPLHLAVMRAWLAALPERKKYCLDSVYKQSLFFFDVISKSLTLKLAREKSLTAAGSRANRIDKDTLQELDTLLAAVCEEVYRWHVGNQKLARRLNRSVSLFFRDLFGILDRDVVIQMVTKYVCSIDPTNRDPVHVATKFECLTIICGYEHFLLINIPFEYPIEDVSKLFSQWWHQHPLIGLLLAEVDQCLSSENASIRQTAIRALRDILWKHDKDPRFADPLAKQRIANCFFPLIQIIASHHEIFDEAPEVEKSDWAVSLLFVLRHCSRAKLLRHWWRNDTQKSLVSFLRALFTCTSVFRQPVMEYESSFVILSVLEDFMGDNKKPISLRENPLIRPVFDVLQGLLDKAQPASFLLAAFDTIRWFINSFPETLFSFPNTTYCGELCYQLLRNTNINNAQIRSRAGSLIWLLIQVNFAQRQSIARMKLQATIAISRLAKSQSTEYAHLRKVMVDVTNMAMKKHGRDGLGAEIAGIVQRLNKVVDDSVRIAEFKFDPEMTQDLYYDVSVGYVDSPDLRVTWLENLANYHKAQKNFDEAAECELLIAALVTQYLFKAGLSQGTGLPLCTTDFESVAPNVDSEPKLPDVPPEKAAEEGVYQSDVFGIAGLLKRLKSASAYFKMGGRYEACLDVLVPFADYQQASRDYVKLGSVFSEMQQVCQTLVNTAGSRLFGNYYRVALVGERWGELNETEYIYKEKNEVLFVQVIKDRLVAQFGQKYGADRLEMLPNTLQLNTAADRKAFLATANKEKNYFQIVTVRPYFTKAELEDRLTPYERNHNIRHFMYETPFTKSTKAHGELSEQWKRKTILTTDRPFPYVKTRLLVTERKVIELSPIENAAELIEEKIHALQEILNAKHDGNPDLKSLQQNLQGTVLPMVNAGPMAIADIFLKNWKDYPAEHVLHLRACMKQLLVTCRFALALNKSQITAEQNDFQEACEDGYATISAALEPIFQEAAKAGKSSST